MRKAPSWKWTVNTCAPVQLETSPAISDVNIRTPSSKWLPLPPPPHGSLVETGVPLILELGLSATPPPPHGISVETGGPFVLQLSLSAATETLGPRSAAGSGGPLKQQLGFKLYDSAMWITFIFDAVLVLYFLVRYIGLMDSPSFNRTAMDLMLASYYCLCGIGCCNFGVYTQQSSR